MSLIERVADKLGSVSVGQQRKPAAALETADAAPPAAVIERASSRAGRLPDLPPVGDPLPEVNVEPVAPLPSRTSARTLQIDMERLHRQSIITPGGGRTPMAESFRRVKRHLLANMASAEAGTAANLIMVTSPFANEGKTFCAINLAVSMAMEMDRTVLLVDADVAKPSVPGTLGFKAEIGLMDVLYKRGTELPDVLCRTNIDKFTILPAGKGRHHATELLASEAMRLLLQEMAERYSDRIIIFDSPPLLAASEASVLALRMGQIIMVVEAEKTTETALKEALSRVESCRNVGLLLNKVEGASQYGGYGYGYGYGYGS
ncbi:MAG TPA: XrtA-associated tyrosine autokinase [Burkholderiales bacterium]|nr:XrtA-associated tyrosine autokinase [Burkholderiales bacterium]